jgi:hypothetical protein
MRELLSVLQANYKCEANANWHAGAGLVEDTTTKLARVADRATDTTNMWIGFSADDTARSGNTIILADPVGSNFVSGSTFVANNNGYYVAAKRAVIENVAGEHINNVTDLTSGSTGFQGPRRPVGVYTTPSGRFVTDQYVAVATDDNDGDLTAPATFAANDLLTWGAGDNKGKLVKLSNASHGRAVARVDDFDATAGLLYITQL